MPLYAVSSGQPVDAVVFASLRPGECRYQGLAREPGSFPSVAAFADSSEGQAIGGWQGLLDRWRTNLEGLGQAFRAGDCRVDPKDYPQTCRYCPLTTLCRVRALHGGAGGHHD